MSFESGHSDASVPTIKIFGNTSLYDELGDYRRALSQEYAINETDARAAGPIFSFNAQVSRAHGLFALPNAHPFHLASVLVESEAGNSFLLEPLRAAAGERSRLASAADRTAGADFATRR